MKKIVDIVQYIYSFIMAVWAFICLSIQELLKLFDILKSAVEYIYNVIINLPPTIQIFAYVSIFIAILFQVLHREQGGNE